MSFIVPPDVIRLSDWGHGWMELRPAPDDPPEIPADDYLLEICWMTDDLMERDSHGSVSTGKWSDSNFTRYGIDWRVWSGTEPSKKKRKEIPWKEEARDAEGHADRGPAEG